jgi:hypothetical protein
MLLRSGDVFANRFEIERAAGAGGMGTVYRATDRVSGDTVALKLLQGRSTATDQLERFVREAELLANLRHPGIVSYVAHGLTPEGQPFLALEWLDGEDLARRLDRGALSLGDTLLLVCNVAGALAVAHQRGVLHRDLKPSNLFLVGGEVARVKIVDFGIARHLAMGITRTGLLIGTPGYMAPEQARGERALTPAADIFSLGCVFYECVAGEPAFAGDHVAAVLVRILFEDPPPLGSRRPGIPAAVTELLKKMLAKHPKERPADADALLAALASLGEVPELPAFPRAFIAPPATSSFAESEQALFSLVVALAREDTNGSNSTLRPEDADAETERRRALVVALRALGARAEFLVGGALVATVSQTGSVTDQAGLAAQAALLIKERWPTAEVSLATGRGVVDGANAVGEVADRAAQLLQKRTRSGSEPTSEVKSGVWLDELSARLLGPRFVVSQTNEGAQLLGAEKEADASRPLLGKPTPCVGRDAELLTLEGQLTGCIENSEARAMLMIAPPGAGKSRLRHEFLRRIEKRDGPLTVLLGRGDLISAGAPCAILAQAIRRLCGIGGSEPMEEQRRLLRARLALHLKADEQQQHVAFIGEFSGIPFPNDGAPLVSAARKDQKLMADSIRRAFLEWLAAECQAAPVLLVLDDLQWGDALTLSFLGDALKSLAGSPLFVLGLARPQINETFPLMRQNPKLQQLQLSALSKKACERLIYQVLGKQVAPETVARAVEQAAGNALFLEELIRAIAEGKSTAEGGAPETVIAMLQARIGRFDAGPRRAVRAAAVFGQTFWDGGVAALLGLPKAGPEVGSWLSTLVDAEVIERRSSSRLAHEDEYAFRHALVRDAAYALLTDSDLKTGHRLAGTFLEAAGERDVVVIADHYRHGGELVRAIPLYQRAGDEAAWLGFQSAARRHYATAISVLEQLPALPELLRMKLDLLLKQIEAGLLTEARDLQLGRLASARQILETLRSQGGLDSPDRLRLARTDYYQGRLAYYGGQSREAIEYYERVIPVATEFGDKEMVVLPSYVIGMALMMQGQMRRGCLLLGQVLDPLRELVSTIDWLRAVSLTT